MLDRLEREDRGASQAWAEAEAVPSFVRAHGGVRVRFGRAGARTSRLESAESGGYRARFPDQASGLACEAVLINTGGGMTGGDSLSVEIVAEAGADAIVTTQAAEKIYRSQGAPTTIVNRLTLCAGARLDWLPQETILFSRAALKRELHVEMADDARLVLCEAVYFGRAAMGEALALASWRDRWRIRRGGRLAFAEDVRLEGAAEDILRRRAVADGARAVATLLMAAPDAAGRLDAVRETAESAASECGAGALDRLLVIRLVSRDAAALRADLARFAAQLTERPLPRSWQT